MKTSDDAACQLKLMYTLWMWGIQNSWQDSLISHNHTLLGMSGIRFSAVINKFDGQVIVYMQSAPGGLP